MDFGLGSLVFVLVLCTLIFVLWARRVRKTNKVSSSKNQEPRTKNKEQSTKNQDQRPKTKAQTHPGNLALFRLFD
jgi:uncharacterized ion transporter superfamily protein YfcC